MDFVSKISSADSTVQVATLFYACCTFGYQLCYALVVCIGEWEFVISKYLIDDKLVVVNTILITALNSSPLTGLKSRRASCFMLCIDLLLCYFEHCHACCGICSQLLFFWILTIFLHYLLDLYCSSLMRHILIFLFLIFRKENYPMPYDDTFLFLIFIFIF